MVGLRPRRDGLMLERTRRGWHVVIRLREKLLPSEIVALQSILGSDGRREALNFMRAFAMRQKCNGVTGYWRKRWNILFAGKLN